ncbi:MAG: hypothetical protein PHF00_11530 [Elusimicrobia bacterium]|nr:hypothetical protein [Elusimicrobiota bacterium]
MSTVYDALVDAAAMPALLRGFGQSVSVEPAAGGPRLELTALVGPYDRGPPELQSLREQDQERIWVALARADWPSPALGDRLWRSEDDAEAPFSFTGETRAATAGYWSLAFSRRRPRRYGPRE